MLPADLLQLFKNHNFPNKMITIANTYNLYLSRREHPAKWKAELPITIVMDIVIFVLMFL